MVLVQWGESTVGFDPRKLGGVRLGSLPDEMQHGHKRNQSALTTATTSSGLPRFGFPGCKSAKSISWRDKAGAEVASPALKILGTRVGGTSFFDDDDFDVSTKALGCAKKMDGEERTSRSTANDGNAIAALEGP